MHLFWTTALQTCTQIPEDRIAILALRLTFGGAPCPFKWGSISETICDLATAIIQDEDWDPEELHAPNQDMVPAAKFLDDDVPFGKAQKLAVDVPINPRGTSDVFIDDMMNMMVALEGSNNAKRVRCNGLLALHAAAWPKHANEPIPRDEMAAENKLKAEAGLEEMKIILGWLFDL